MSNESSLGFFLLAVLIGFAVLIYILLNYRKSWLKENLLITAEQIWETISERAEKLNFKKSELLFAISQDATATTVCLVVKDSKNQIVGQVFSQMATRQRTIKMDNDTFTIDFPLTWNRTAILRKSNGGGIIAKYTQTSWFGRHQFEVTGHGKLKSERPSLNAKIVFNYRIGEKLIGTAQEISSTREKGRLVVLPLDIPLEVRIFVLAV